MLRARARVRPPAFGRPLFYALWTTTVPCAWRRRARALARAPPPVASATLPPSPRRRAQHGALGAQAGHHGASSGGPRFRSRTRPLVWPGGADASHAATGCARRRRSVVIRRSRPAPRLSVPTQVRSAPAWPPWRRAHGAAVARLALCWRLAGRARARLGGAAAWPPRARDACFVGGRGRDGGGGGAAAAAAAAAASPAPLSRGCAAAAAALAAATACASLRLRLCRLRGNGSRNLARPVLVARAALSAHACSSSKGTHACAWTVLRVGCIHLLCAALVARFI